MFVHCNLNLDTLKKTIQTEFPQDKNLIDRMVTLEGCNLGCAACTRIHLTAAPLSPRIRGRWHENVMELSKEVQTSIVTRHSTENCTSLFQVKRICSSPFLIPDTRHKLNSR
jgi:hypothetical protein